MNKINLEKIEGNLADFNDLPRDIGSIIADLVKNQKKLVATVKALRIELAESQQKLQAYRLDRNPGSPDLQAIKRRHAEATPGPWFYATSDGHYRPFPRAIWNTAGIFWDDNHKEITTSGGGNVLAQVLNGEGNARFIANSWQDIKELLAYVEKLEKLAEAKDN